MIFVDRGRLHNGQPILPLGTWMQRAGNKTNEAINDGPGHATGSVSAREGSPKGEASIEIFGLKQKRLRDARRAVLATISELIEAFVEEDIPRGTATRKVLAVLSQPRHQYSALASAVRDDPAKFGF
jgi:hypothetical protein